MSLESLTQAVGPTGDLCRKPCPAHTDHLRQDDTAGRSGPCPTCGGPGKVWDDQNPIVQALLEECSIGEEMVCGWCHDTGWRPRPRAEAALALWNAAKPMMRSEGWFVVPVENGWEIWRSFKAEHFSVVGKRQPSPEDALAAAVEAVLKEAT